MERIKIGITHGDTNGVGYEVILKAFEDPTVLELCTPIIYGSPKVATYHRKAMELGTSFNTVASADKITEGKLNMVDTIKEEVKIDLGQGTQESGKAALQSLEAAIEDYKQGLIDVLVTAPINKHCIQSDEFQFPGHTEYIQNRTGEGQEAMMILMNSMVRIALATTHLPLSQVAGALTQEGILNKLRILNQSLKRDFTLSSPRIAVLGLNPHAGDNGLIGNEEQEIIIPAMQQAEEEGIHCFGPFPADGFF
ncbi:MAG: 4-hydroxythreonine-4-phosphate dehydrogenase PdxA, partial [Bacteroidaceae bacterium]|nr:4-hydroxythreonine-4-phosphate dehydrogenase PdxA [Bacteroidaceae bacterium]